MRMCCEILDLCIDNSVDSLEVVADISWTCKLSSIAMRKLENSLGINNQKRIRQEKVQKTIRSKYNSVGETEFD